MRLSLAVGMMAIGLSFSGTKAQRNIQEDDGRTKANFDGPFRNICKLPGNNCETPVVVIVKK